MTTLIALLSSGKGTWTHVNSLISSQKWEKIILFCNEFAYKNYENMNPNILKLQLQEQYSEDFIKTISKVLHTQVQDFEVALNFASGTGIEHMMIVAGIIKAGLGFRLVVFENGEFIDINLYQTPELLGDQSAG